MERTKTVVKVPNYNLIVNNGVQFHRRLKSRLRSSHLLMSAYQHIDRETEYRKCTGLKVITDTTELIKFILNDW